MEEECNDTPSKGLRNIFPGEAGISALLSSLLAWSSGLGLSCRE